MEDKELVTRILNKGDSQLFGVLVKCYSSEIFSRVFRLLRDEEKAKDTVQQAFITAYERLADWRGGSFKAWLNSIAVHLALQLLNKEKRWQTDSLETLESTIPSVEFSEVHEDLLCSMEKAIDLLPENDRKIIEWHYYKRMKVDDIAYSLGLTTSNVLVRLHRIRERLRKEVKYERE